ncbi:esterase [Chroococcidiopsis sp. CCALA 051]|uniref:YheT family hydrolase n=1 Tax=Chroococcidiopsis sp. CCALA 051 TaxID=869949 RepID=UPI000D0E095F|nr:alpha/beta fold hydrolase [Chroococcidiopsidales cyanobacterium LEGE 13417]PSM45920.1 esterase [Chroococcidiopsis sp. CCALA 051]
MHRGKLNSNFTPPWWLRNGLAMTVYTALWASKDWEKTTSHPEPNYEAVIFHGAGEVPIFGWVAIPENPKATIVGTYGITGTLENQWFLRLLGRKAFAQGYAVVLFDWRAHGKTAQLSPTLTSDGLYEGEDFVCIAAQAKAMGCPAPFWFTGFSLGGQLALWGVKAAQALEFGIRSSEFGINSPFPTPNSLIPQDIAGAAVICPSLDSNRSLSYLVKHPLGRKLEQAIAKQLKKLAWQIYEAHPGAIDPAAIEKANSIWGFDNELVIEKLGFPSVEAYYEASSGLHILPQLQKPTLIIYAANDPMFDPAIVPDLQAACDRNPQLDLLLTRYGGHVNYMSDRTCQQHFADPDPWWAWNRVLEWIDSQ